MKTILAIDDSKVALMQVKKYLSNIYPDCELLTSTDPREGIELAKQNKDKIDLVILDFNMKEMTGLDVLEAIENDVSVSKIVICTANVQKILASKVNEKGARYLEKPLNQEKMNQLCGVTAQKAS